MIPFGSFAQIGDEFYLEAYNKADLTPINQTQNGKYIELEFSDPQLNSIFDNFQILNYEEAFDGLALCNAYDLDKVFILKLDSPVGINRLTVSPLIKKVEFPIKYELASNNLPNDYYIPTFDESNQYESPGDTIRNDYLDLIQAPCAWELTKGDPSVLVGVSDSYFSEVHEELQGKFEIILGTGAVNQNYKHGIETSSLIAGNSHNNKGTASIGYNTRLAGAIGINKNKVEDLVEWSVTNNKNLRVINMSWGGPKDRDAENSAYEFMDENHSDAKLYRCLRDQYNIVLVASAGNKSHITAIKPNGEPIFPGGWKNEVNRFRAYPASFESVISVTSVGSRYDHANVDPYNTTSNDGLLKDVLWWNGAICCSDYYLGRLNHQYLNDKIDIAAPGHRVYRATNSRKYANDSDGIDTYTKYGSGTSISAPIVSGTAALMLAANPELTAVEVKDILKFTADRIDTIPHNQQYFGQNENELSIQLGRLNAYKAVKMAKYFDEYGYDFDSMPKKIDLMVRDNEEDIGQEPNETTEIFWNSPDIWVRNQPDGIEEYENVEYEPNGQSYVYVRVKNIGCDPTSEDDQLKLYWTKAASSMSWPEDYMGEEYIQPGNALKGDTIGTVNIPSIKPGEETILEVPWSNIPDPEDYKLI
ncbi:MAG TPA: S8 family serine peptidase, partial [Flavobacteriaceae bacterium]|nr:S8 family serine peptidase [Flavobacteriaceae bacterium]